MHERMPAGDPNIADDPAIREALLQAIGLTDEFNATSARDPERQRRLLGHLLGAITIGANAVGNPARVVRPIEPGAA